MDRDSVKSILNYYGVVVENIDIVDISTDVFIPALFKCTNGSYKNGEINLLTMMNRPYITPVNAQDLNFDGDDEDLWIPGQES